MTMRANQHLLRCNIKKSLVPNPHSKLFSQCQVLNSHTRNPFSTSCQHYVNNFGRPIPSVTAIPSSFYKCTVRHFQCLKIVRYTTSLNTRVNFSSSPSDNSNVDDANDANDADNDDNKDKPSENMKAYQNHYEGIDTKTRQEMQKRHQGIEMNSDGLSQFILPGEYVVKTNQKTGDKKMVSIERSLGYFWYMKDLRDSNDKPIISNSKLIPSEIAQVFPPLGDIGVPLTTLTDEQISLPQFFTRNNRSMDESAHCTLVAINFNAYGYQMLPSWTKPFEEAFIPNDSNRVEVVHLSIQEGYTLRFLRYIINRGYQKNVAESKKERTAMYFGHCPELRDVLRMHNDKTGYVYLLDGIGRVRFAGSGMATHDDIELMLKFVNKLTPGLKGRGDRGRR